MVALRSIRLFKSWQRFTKIYCNLIDEHHQNKSKSHFNWFMEIWVYINNSTSKIWFPHVFLEIRFEYHYIRLCMVSGIDRHRAEGWESDRADNISRTWSVHFQRTICLQFDRVEHISRTFAPSHNTLCLKFDREDRISRT